MKEQRNREGSVEWENKSRGQCRDYRDTGHEEVGGNWDRNVQEVVR